MGRAHGRRNTARPAVVDPDSEAGRDIGMSDRVQGTPSPIPGGEQHLVNHETMRQKAPIPAFRPEFRGMMAHGVPPGTHTTHERATNMRGPNHQDGPSPAPATTGKPVPPVTPVPVTIVAAQNDIAPLLLSSHRRIQVPAFGGGADPVQLCGRDSHRKSVLLLNEDSTHHIRFANQLSELNIQNEGSVLPATTSSYLRLHTQGELYAISNDSGTPYVSVIQEYEQPGAEVGK